MIRIAVVLFMLMAGAALAQTAPATQEAHLSRGAQRMQQHLYEEAAKEFGDAVAQDPKDPRAHLQLGVALMSLGRNDEARKQFEQVHLQGSGSRYVTYYLGRLDLLANDYASAVRKLSSVSENPPFPDTAFFLGVACMSNGDVVAGVKWLAQAAKLMPRDYRVHYRLARAYSTAGRDEDANREYALYNRLRDEHKNTETAARECTAALRAGSPDTARDICHRMYDPNDPEKLTLLGQLFGDAGDFPDALPPLQRAVQLDPGSFEAWHNLGLTCFRLQRYRDAREPLQRAVTLRPEFYPSVVLLGATLYMLGDDDAALPVLEHAHQLNPADTQTSEVLDKLRAERARK